MHWICWYTVKTHMKIIIKGTHIDLTPEIRSAIDGKIGELDRFTSFSGTDVEARVDVGRSTFHHQHGDVYFAKVDVHVSGRTVHAEAEGADIISALTEVKDQLQIEIKKFKQKGFAQRLKAWRVWKKFKNQ